MIFVRDKGQMCNNIYQFANAYAFARESGRRAVSMRFSYKYQYFRICSTPWHNTLTYVVVKLAAKCGLIPVLNYEAHTTPEQMQANDRRILASRHAVLQGWSFRRLDLLERYVPELAQLFDFKPSIRRKVEASMAAHGLGVRIGVHVRRGDYEKWAGGMFFFDDAAYIASLRELIADVGGERVTVYVCGNDPRLNHSAYAGALEGVEVHFPQGNPGEDLCLLSMCDYVVGPPSSFSLIATMYGRARLHWMGIGLKAVRANCHGFMHWARRVDEVMSMWL